MGTQTQPSILYWNPKMMYPLKILKQIKNELTTQDDREDITLHTSCSKMTARYNKV